MNENENYECPGCLDGTHTVKLDLTTANTDPIYVHTCPDCQGQFNYPARFDTSFGGYDACPLCGKALPEGFLDEDSPIE
jgi:hypothetical protein